MKNQGPKPSQSNWVGILLIVLGLLFFLDSFNILNFGHFIADWWPLILILIGFSKLSGFNKTGGVILLLIGFVFLTANLGIIRWGNVFRFWPLILIIIGISIIFRSRNLHHWGISNDHETSADFLRSSAIFGGVDRKVVSQNFQGGNITSLFGGFDLDLRQAKISPEGCILNLTSIFGGIDILVPPDCQVSVTGTPIFGGIDNAQTYAATQENGVKMNCNCTVLFGGIEIRS